MNDERSGTPSPDNPNQSEKNPRRNDFSRRSDRNINDRDEFNEKTISQPLRSFCIERCGILNPTTSDFITPEQRKTSIRIRDGTVGFLGFWVFGFLSKNPKPTGFLGFLLPD